MLHHRPTKRLTTTTMNRILVLYLSNGENALSIRFFLLLLPPRQPQVLPVVPSFSLSIRSPCPLLLLLLLIQCLARRKGSRYSFPDSEGRNRLYRSCKDARRERQTVRGSVSGGKRFGISTGGPDYPAADPVLQCLSLLPFSFCFARPHPPTDGNHMESLPLCSCIHETSLGD